jgi:hypothetical protein
MSALCIFWNSKNCSYEEPYNLRYTREDLWKWTLLRAENLPSNLGICEPSTKQQAVSSTQEHGSIAAYFILVPGLLFYIVILKA